MDIQTFLPSVEMIYKSGWTKKKQKWWKQLTVCTFACTCVCVCVYMDVYGCGYACLCLHMNDHPSQIRNPWLMWGNLKMNSLEIR